MSQGEATGARPFGRHNRSVVRIWEHGEISSWEETHMGHLIAWILVGLIAGAVAGRVVEGGGFGFVGDVVVGIVGAFVGGLILHALTGSDVAASFIGEIVVAFLGACLLLALLRAVGRGTRGERGATAAFRR